MNKKQQYGANHIHFEVEEQKGPPKVDYGKQDKQFKQQEGVELSKSQQLYLLPHFTMVMVGKPGSGKTSTLRTMMNSPDFFLHKFDQVLLLSPSANKMGIRVKKDNISQQFDLKWIENKLFEMNKKQAQAIAARLKELNIIDKFDTEKLNGHLMDTIRTDMSSKSNPTTVQTAMPNLYADKERFFTPGIKKVMEQGRAPTNKKKQPGGAQANSQVADLAQYVDRMYEDYYQKLPQQDKYTFQKNCLIIFDDMVSQIKANEFNPLLTQLIFNRRHLLLGGTISIIIVSQKYTMIPARVRSNANWLLLFRLNPVDFENVFKDVVMMSHPEWEHLLDFMFGGVEKKYNNLGIWVETDDYFQNFQHLKFEQ